MAGGALFVQSNAPATPGGPIAGAPDVGLGLAVARSDLLAQADAARFTLATAAVGVCPIRWWALRACGTFEAGWLAAEGVNVARPSSERSFWAAAGAVVRAQARPWRRLVAEARVGVRAPLRRTDFVLDLPSRPAGSVPALVVDGGLALGFPLP
jgi:hypothetical protein